MTEEIWVLINDTNGAYEVSNTGKIRNTETGRILVPRPTKNGYLRVQIPINGRRQDAYIHRIVASEFCNRFSGNDVVNHIDNNPKNNSADNLEWTTVRGNVLHCMKQKRTSFPNAKTIIGIKDGIKTLFSSSHEAAECTGCDHSAIIKCCKGKCKSTHGYQWKYAEVV